MQRKMKLKWFGGNSEVSQQVSYAEMSSGSGFTMLSLSQGVQVGVYGEKRELSFERVSGCSTCEEVCLALAETQGIAPAVVDCFGLAFDNSQDGRYTWLAPGELPDLGEKKLCFRMRFVPVKEKCRDILSQYSACLQYLFYQVKYDYVHGDLKYLKGQEKDKDSRGVGAFVILIMMRISAQNTGTEENVENFFRSISLKDFFPPALTRNFIDKRFLEGSIRNKLKDYQDKNPSDSYPADILMRSFLEHILQSDKDFYEESYSAYQLDLENIQVQESDTSGHTQYTNELRMKSSSAVSLSINLNGDSSKLKIISGKPSCEIFLQKIYEVKLQQLTFEGMDWFEVQIIAQAQYEKVYFKDRLESHSFVTCLEKYCLLMFNYYTSLCPDLQSPRIHKQYQVRAHGPVSEATIRKKLSQRGLQCRDWYVLRSNLQKFGQYDVLYLRTPKDKSLIVRSFGKVMEREDGLVLEGSQADPVSPKLFFRQQAKALGFLPSNVIPVQPQSEGCDIVQNLLTKHAITLQNAIDLETEEEEKRRIASQPKVYMAGQVNIAAKIGEGHFTEVYKGRLCEQQHVVIKQLRLDPALQRHHQQLHESLMSGFEVLLKLNGSNLFVNFLGLTLGPSTGLLMSGTGLCSMKAFLRMDRTGLPQLTFVHLIDVSICLAEALQYMEQKNCFHGNLTCENLVVEKFDNRVLEIKVTDPGLVCFYQQLPLDHEVNIKRLPWLDPNMYKPGGLKEVTAKTEVWALGSTLWQMFEGGASPWEAINSKGGRRSIEAVQQFFLVNKKVPRCPKLLKLQADDSEPVQKYKQEFYMKLQYCWTLDSEERPCPEALLRTFISCFQEHSREYHEYSQPIYSAGSSGLSSMDSATTEFLNSGYTGTSKPIPNLSCLNSSASGGTIPKTETKTIQEFELEPSDYQGEYLSHFMRSEDSGNKFRSGLSNRFAMSEREIMDLSLAIKDMDFEELPLHLRFTSIQCLEFRRLRDEFPAYRLLKAWQEVVVECDENPKKLLAGALLACGFKDLAVSSFGKEFVYAEGRTEPNPETIKRIQEIVWEKRSSISFISERPYHHTASGGTIPKTETKTIQELELEPSDYRGEHLSHSMRSEDPGKKIRSGLTNRFAMNDREIMVLSQEIEVMNFEEFAFHLGFTLIQRRALRRLRDETLRSRITRETASTYFQRYPLFMMKRQHAEENCWIQEVRVLQGLASRLLKVWHDAVVECDENPKELLAYALLKCGYSKLVVKSIGERCIYDAIGKEPKQKTIKRIREIDFETDISLRYIEKEVLPLFSNEKYHINPDLHLSEEAITEQKRLEEDLLISIKESAGEHRVEDGSHVIGKWLEEEHQLEDDLHLTGEDVAEDHCMKDDLHVLEKEVSKEHGEEDDVHVPGKEVANEQPIEDNLHMPIKESAGEDRVEDGSHVIGKGVEDEHHLEADLTGKDLAEDHRMKDDLNALEKQVPKEHGGRDDLHLTGKDVAGDRGMKGDLYVPIKESTGEHMIADGSHVPVKDFAGKHPVEDNLHVLGKGVAKEHRVKDDLNVPGKGVAREHPVEDDLHVLGIRVATEHRVEDDLHIVGKEVSGEHRMEGYLHVPRKDAARENRLKDKKHVLGKEVEQKYLMKDSLHVHEKEVAGGHRLENGSNAPGKIVAEEHHTKDDDSEVWDRCFEQGKFYIRILLKRGLFPPADILDELCDCYGRKSRIVNDLCSFAKQKIKKDIESTFETKVLDIYPSFKDGAENTIVFVVTLTKRVNKAEIREMIIYAVEIKYLNAYNKETTLLAQHILKEQIYMTKDELQNVQSCQENMEEELFAKHYYLSMITSAPVKSYQYSESGQHINVERKVCLQLYIHAKGFIPIWEDPFEKQYRGIDTDIIECVFISFGKTAREPHDNIKMGCLIQRENIPPHSTDFTHPPIKGGTLGGFIEHPELGLCGITCAHAMIYKCEFEKCVEHNNKLSLQDWPADLKQKTAVYQPDQSSSDIGVLSEAYYDTGGPSRPGIDIALIKIRNRHPVNGKFPVVEQQGTRSEVGKVFETGAKVDYTTLAIDRHIEVWKFGSTTGSTNAFLSSGPITAREIKFEWRNDGTYKIKLHKQIRVTSMDSVPFALHGDSGALVFHEQPPDRQLVCIGMVEGGFDDNPALTVVAPIIPALERLKVQSIYTFSNTKLYEMEARLERNFTKAMKANQADFEILKSNQAEIMREIRNLRQVPMDEN